MRASQPSRSPEPKLPPSDQPLAYAVLVADPEVAPAFLDALAETLVGAGLGVMTVTGSSADEVTAGLGAHPDLAPRLLVGVGRRSAAALLAAPSLPSVRVAVTIGAEVRPEEEDDLAAALAHETCAHLFLHAPDDPRTPLRHAATLYRLARHPKSFVALPGAEQGFGELEPKTRAQEARGRYAGRLIALWADPYLGVAPDRQAAYSAQRSSVARTEAGFHTRVSVRGFELAADEPASVGGTERAPTPMDYLAVALSSCTAMTVRMYADRKGWPLTAVTVRAKQRKGKERAVFERTVELEGELDAQQRARLLEIADRCPVHRLLEAGAEIVSPVQEDAAERQGVEGAVGQGAKADL